MLSQEPAQQAFWGEMLRTALSRLGAASDPLLPCLAGELKEAASPVRHSDRGGDWLEQVPSGYRRRAHGFMTSALLRMHLPWSWSYATGS